MKSYSKGVQRCVCLYATVFSASASISLAVQISSISGNPTVGRFEKYEAAFTLDMVYSNPFDPDIVDIRAEITGPDEVVCEVPAFFYRDYEVYDVNPERYRNPGPEQWMFRFSPSEAGPYSYDIVVYENGAMALREEQAGMFECIDSANKGFIRRDGLDPACLRYDNGQPYLPIGHNVCWTSNGLGTFESNFQQMGVVGENWTRVWMTHFYNCSILEWRSDYSSYYQNLGRYSLQIAQRLDAMVEAAEQQGIGLQLVLQHHGQFSSTVNPNWDENPYNIANAAYGGFLSHPEDFFTDAQARKLTRNKYRYIIARWGYSPAILAWELWNEVQFTDGWSLNRDSVIAWHQEMADYIRSIDSHRHLITTSSNESGFASIWNHDTIDVVQVHHYGTPVIEPFKTATLELAQTYHKPVIIGEFGAGSVNGMNSETSIPDLPEPYKTQMLEGLVLHNGIWSAFFAKGSAHLWWWDTYIEAYGMYDIFAPLAIYAEGEDLAGMQPAPRAVQGFPSYWANPQVGDFFYMPTQKEFTLTGDIFLGMDKLGRYLHGGWQSARKTDPTFHLTMPEAGRLVLHVKEVSSYGSNSLRVRVNGAEVFSSGYAAGANNFTVSVGLTAGTQSVQVENTGQDWFDIASYEFAPNGDYLLNSTGLMSSDKALFWIYDINSQYGQVPSGVFSGEPMTVKGLSDGLYQVDFYHTRAGGGRFLRQHQASEAGQLSCTIPDFEYDIAVKVAPACVVDLPLLEIMAEEWMFTGAGMRSDYIEDRKINYLDFQELSAHWLDFCPESWW
jgi:hypothetical protein